MDSTIILKSMREEDINWIQNRTEVLPEARFMATDKLPRLRGRRLLF